MKVTVKNDIYSFGVVLLELTTGRAAVTGDEHMNLAEWAHRHCENGTLIVDAFDADIKATDCLEPAYLESMTTVFKLGLLCASKSPSTRPSMRKVCQILQLCCRTTNIPLS